MFQQRFPRVDRTIALYRAFAATAATAFLMIFHRDFTMMLLSTMQMRRRDDERVRRTRIITNRGGLSINVCNNKPGKAQISVGLAVEIWGVILPHEFQCATDSVRLRSAKIGSRNQPNC
ncbi:Uncharacterized protein DBV15_01801 [Temnothorax longispinosus]|uniref:Uncharacterized protein n=1 Tax=Temnothorax longispinosus TaxID=300112 RepID=A0A4S2KMU7_9HYME|nr:Uncharacterized protein DBV15_01801 [Temnothorax longispinosus]